MTPPRRTPGGLATQFSSAGHFDLSPDQAMIVTVPAAGQDVAPYQGIQLGSMWYVSLDYINHQTSLTADQARHDPDGKLRFVITQARPWRRELAGADRADPRLRADPLAAADQGPRPAATGRRSRWCGPPAWRRHCRTTSSRGSRRGLPRADRRAPGSRREPDGRLTVTGLMASQRTVSALMLTRRRGAELMYLQDKVLVVSGVGPDLGRQIAVRGAAAGADVVLAARTVSRLEEVAAEIKELGRRALVVPTDMTVEADAERLAAAAVAEFGKVDALVHNALVMPPITDLAKVDLDAVQAGFNNNVISALRMTRLFIPALAETKGAVVMVNSMVIRFSQLTMGPYKMAKSSLLAMASSLATELGPQGIRVNSVAPGHIWGESLKWYFNYLAKKRGVDRRRDLRRDGQEHRPAAGCRSRTRSPTPCCSSPRRWRARSPVSAWTSTAASTTTTDMTRATDRDDSVGTVDGPARVGQPDDRPDRLRRRTTTATGWR